MSRNTFFYMFFVKIFKLNFAEQRKNSIFVQILIYEN